jgi:integrase
MAKKSEIDITTTAGRKRLDPRNDPYYRKEKGGALGFRCSGANGEGTWIGRSTDNTGKYVYRPLGRMSDYREALAAFTRWIEEVELQNLGGLSKDARKATVGDAARNYLAWLEETRVSEAARKDARARIEYLILGREKRLRSVPRPPHPIASIRLAELTKRNLLDFQKELLKGDTEATADRKVKNTANRNWTSVVALLNKAKEDGMIATDIAWSGIALFTGAAAGHKDSYRYLTSKERGGIIASFEDDEDRDYHELLALIGCRPIELDKAHVSDYDRRTKILHLWSFKGKGSERAEREVPVGVMGKAAAIIERRIKNKLPSAPIFSVLKKDRQKAMLAAAAKAKVEDATAYCFRHSFITDCITNDVNILEVARITGTSMQMIQKTYGKLIVARFAESFKRLELVA